ncbi:hypothetical protein NDU88_004254 [Pleurodeles waltl]|uniref:Retrotransposon gag domain-containing protein n=1 Tax=Pleurodeles waltl TaxID=8319 RepID=A0AAV7MU14_PLEWA|nr:hypothetical protein NDU88_004254 [Pleurodeles waltl]
MVSALLPFNKLVDPATESPHWKIWVGRLESYFVATRENYGAVKQSLLLHFGGDEIYKLFRHIPNTRAVDDYDAAVRALNMHFDPQQNPDFERLKLRQAHQRERESIDQLYARFRELVRTCTEVDQPKEIWSRITKGCSNKSIRGLILRQPNISLDDILIMVRSHYLSAAEQTKWT